MRSSGQADQGRRKRSVLRTRAPRVPICAGQTTSDERRLSLAADFAYLLAGAVELFIRHHRGALEGQVAVDLDPGATAVVLLANPHRYGARDAVDPQQEDVKWVAALPAEPLLGVIGGPDVIRRKRVEGAAVVDRDVVGHFGPGAQPNPVRL